MAQKLQVIGGSPLVTQTLTATDDTVKTLAATLLSRSAAEGPADHDSFHITITPETYGIRVAFGVDPVPSGLGKVIAPGQELHLDSRAQAQHFRYCNSTAGQNAVIHVYPEV